MPLTRRRQTATALARYALGGAALALSLGAQAATVNLTVVEGNCNDLAAPGVSGFRWLLQEDKTFPVAPGVQIPVNPGDPYPPSMTFHASHHPVAKDTNGAGLSGNEPGNSVAIDNVPVDSQGSGYYYVSVLPYSGYSISGAPVRVTPGSAGPTEVCVAVQKHPIPTAQIALFLFRDNYPINGAPDLPEEENPPPGDPGYVDWSEFSIVLEEPAGRYGQNGGPIIQDAFGNPLGTTYCRDAVTNEPIECDGDPATFPDVLVEGDGTLHPDADTGTLLIKNLSPGKYGVIVNTPTGQNWNQTTTIEGTRVNDAWVKANEPSVFVEFGLPGPHVFFGFVKATADGGPQLPPNDGGTAADVSGIITDMHMSRPPNFTFYSGRDFPQCWIGLNDTTVGLGQGVYAAPCDGSSFTIPSVPPGNYQLKVWDTNLDVVIATLGFTVDPQGTCNGGTSSCDFGEVPVFNWFTRLIGGIFNDTNENGFWDAGEIGVQDRAVNLRWRDGSMYQSFATDGEGIAPFDEVFPFFHWLVAEVDFIDKKATGATFVIDAGGPVDKGTDAFPGFGQLTPQPQCIDAIDVSTVGYDPTTDTCPVGSEAINTAATDPAFHDNLSRTETGPVLTQGIQGFLGQTNVALFGKVDYKAYDFSSFPPTFIGENGGISGIVFYATTRAEDDPRYAAAETWEPGIPRVQVALYADGDINCDPTDDVNPLTAFPNGACDIDWNNDGDQEPNSGAIYDIDQDGIITLADVDNYPLGWGTGVGTKGPEDVDRDGDGAFDLGDALNVAWTDSWDDSLPTGCQGQTYYAFGDPQLPTDCFDGLRNFNQIRPGVFDGGYAIDAYDMAHLPATIAEKLSLFYAQPAVSAVGFEGLIPGDYIVATAVPPGYELVSEEHKNVDFGDGYIPSPQAEPPFCVGEGHLVPDYLAMQTIPVPDGLGGVIYEPVVPLDELIAAPYAGETRPLCDRKSISLSSSQNAAVDFFLMTDVPVVANVTGGILNDLANEFNPNAPAFGEKFAPPWLPVAFYDWNGNQVNRVYADQFGKYNAVVPSTWTADRPQPSGMAPNMLVSCKNDAGPIEDPNNPGQYIIDPWFDPQYSQFCYTFQYMPGVATYLDTPVLPIAAFAGPGQFPVDCERPTRTPMIASVTKSDSTGPYVLPGDTITVNSMGLTTVLNPEWPGSGPRKTITRNYSFSAGIGNPNNPDRGNVFLEDEAGVRIPLNPTASNWSFGAITATVPTTVAPGDYQVVVRNSPVSGGAETPIGVTLTVGDPSGNTYAVHTVSPAAAPATPIQDAIDAAAPGDLILVSPGIYNELVIMYKPVRLQGWGAAVTSINARQVPTEKITNWRAKVAQLVDDGDITLLPGQEALPGFPGLGAALFPTEEGAGVFVAGVSSGPNRFGALANRGARVDGFTILGASTGGGIVVNGYAQFLEIGNNRLTANGGFYGGGIRIGHPTLTNEVDGLAYTDSVNDQVRIHHNHIAKNGGQLGAGGGISLHTGADGYDVVENWVCGNFSQGSGGGIGHLGRSNNGLIEDNIVNFNESFSQANAESGGGIFVGGAPALVAGGVSPGSGNVIIDANLIRGNLAGAGDGGGIRIASANGEDVAASPTTVTDWYRVAVFNNMINNNVSGLAGGGVSVEDSLRVVIRNNTVANNDSTATTALSFEPGFPNISVAQPAGIVSRVNSTALAAIVGAGFSDPVLRDNIVYHNRSFYWLNYDDPATAIIETGLYPSHCPPTGSGTPADPYAPPATCDLAAVAEYTWDLAVLSGNVDQAPTYQLDPRYSLLTDTTGYHLSNISGDPAFVNGYLNVGRDNTLLFPEFTVLQTAGAFDEGGNFIQVAFGPLSLVQPDTNLANPEGPLFDYHIGGGSAAIDAGGNVAGLLLEDFDNDPRPQGAGTDIGADEVQ